MTVKKPERIMNQKIKRLADKRETPFLVIEKKSVLKRFKLFAKSLPAALIFYAVKANADKRIIKLLHAEGCGFEVSSIRELKLVLDCGVPSHRIISSNPIKSPAFIQTAYQAGVNHFAFDSAEEINKLS